MQDHQCTSHLSSAPVFLSISQRIYRDQLSMQLTIVTISDHWGLLLNLESQIWNTILYQRSGLSAIGDILRHRRLSLFGHVARLDPGVPALMLRVWWWIPTKAESQWPPGEDHRAALATSGSTRSRRMPTPYRCLRGGDLRSPAGSWSGATVHSDYSTTMMMILAWCTDTKICDYLKKNDIQYDSKTANMFVNTIQCNTTEWLPYVVKGGQRIRDRTARKTTRKYTVNTQTQISLKQ